MNAAIRDLSRKAAKLASGPIARGSIVSVAIKMSGLILSFVQAIIVARLLGAEGYGLVAVAISVAQIGATLALFGYGTLATREVAGWLSNGKQYLLTPFARHATRTVIGLSLAIAALIWTATAFFGGQLVDYNEVIWISVLIIPLLALIQLFRGITQGFGDVTSAQWPGEILRPALVITMVIASLAFIPQLTAPAFLIAFALAGFASILASGVLVQKHLSMHNTAPARTDHPSWLGQAAPFFGLSMLAILQGELATLMLAIFASPEQAGLYQPIARLTPIIALPASAAAMRYAPRVSEFWNSKQVPRLVAITRTYTLATAGLTTLATFVLAGLGPWILLAFGADFVSVAPLLWIVGLAQIFNTSCGPVGYLLTMTGRTRAATLSKIVGLVTAISASLLLVPEHGALGAAIAVSLGLVSWNIVALIAVRRLLGFDPSLLQFMTGQSSIAGSLK